MGSNPQADRQPAAPFGLAVVGSLALTLD